MSIDQKHVITGTNATLVSEAAQDQTMVAAQGVHTRLRLHKVYIACTLAATGGGGTVDIEDGVGGANLVSLSGVTTGNTGMLDFGETGPLLSENTLVNLTAKAATTNEASARAVVSVIVERNITP